MTAPTERPDLSSVPLFPLPNVVLFPRAVLPLHIFEERYKTMTADALAGGRQVAMALLKSGWEKNYYHRPEIEPVVCVGTILSHEKLPDGKYNFLLQGHTRARIVREVGDRPYRMAKLEPVRETTADEPDLADERVRLGRLFRAALLGGTPVGRQFRQLLAGEVRTGLQKRTAEDFRTLFHLLDFLADCLKFVGGVNVGNAHDLVLSVGG